MLLAAESVTAVFVAVEPAAAPPIPVVAALLPIVDAAPLPALVGVPMVVAGPKSSMTSVSVGRALPHAMMPIIGAPKSAHRQVEGMGAVYQKPSSLPSALKSASKLRSTGFLARPSLLFCQKYCPVFSNTSSTRGVWPNRYGKNVSVRLVL